MMRSNMLDIWSPSSDGASISLAPTVGQGAMSIRRTGASHPKKNHF